MVIQFQKYQGTGNDFVVVDNRNGLFPAENLSVIQRICHRKYGIGSDGLILIEHDDKSDFYMNFFNPDGSKSYCGNGSRCAVHFARSVGMIGDKCTYRAIDGIHHGVLSENSNVSTSILPVHQTEHIGNDVFINTGSPHYIVFCSNLDLIDIISDARKIRYSARFAPSGTNVNFVQKVSDIQIKMRTYERGVEDETLSCGTGVTAAALAVLKNDGTISVETKGGMLSVNARKSSVGFEDIWLSGPATPVFKGEYKIENQ
jgi:diaminopimelate epimerase